MSRVRSLCTAVAAVSLMAGLAGCAPAKLDVSDVAGIIDVRTSEEFAVSHITGATNISYEESGFLVNANTLRKTEKFYVYGTTSEQAGEAVLALRSLGMGDLTNLGSFEDAQSILPLGVTK